MMNDEKEKCLPVPKTPKLKLLLLEIKMDFRAINTAGIKELIIGIDSHFSS
jgi:hypothetical protein